MRVDAAVQIIHAGGGHWFEEQKKYISGDKYL